MKFSQNKNKNFSIKNIVTKNQFKPVFNLPLMIFAIIFTLAAGSFLVVPHSTLKQVINIENAIVTIIVALVGAFIIIVLGQIKKRSMVNSWPKVNATCIGWDVYAIYGPRGRTWILEILCTYNVNSKKVELTPKIADMSWFFRDKAISFLDSKVDIKGYCELRVNSDDHLDAYLLPLDNRVFYFLGWFAFLAIFIGGIFCL